MSDQGIVLDVGGMRLTQNWRRKETTMAPSDDETICIECSGSGEGSHDGARCPACRGKGTVRSGSDEAWDEYYLDTPEYDARAEDAWESWRDALAER